MVRLDGVEVVAVAAFEPELVAVVAPEFVARAISMALTSKVESVTSS